MDYYGWNELVYRLARFPAPPSEYASLLESALYRVVETQGRHFRSTYRLIFGQMDVELDRMKQERIALNLANRSSIETSNAVQ